MDVEYKAYTHWDILENLKSVKMLNNGNVEDIYSK